jgi:predicted dehydrogenase
LAGRRYDGVIIASPPTAHVGQAITCLSAGIPVLLEKPVSAALAEARTLQVEVAATGVALLLGYTWRWWPPLGTVKRLLQEQAIGPLRHARFVLSAHLADWHPWENYQDFFMAHRDLGGGALLDESHWLDIMLWLFGMPQEVFARIEKISDLQISTDDNVDMLLTYPDGLRVNVHLDLYGRPHQKRVELVGERGTIEWSERPNRVSYGKDLEADWTVQEFDCQRNAMFVAAAREFLEVIRGGKVRTCGIDDGVAVLRVIEAARRSHAQRSSVLLTEVT